MSKLLYSKILNISLKFLTLTTVGHLFAPPHPKDNPNPATTPFKQPQGVPGDLDIGSIETVGIYKTAPVK
ncbi:MAG: hypothetical protein P4L69_19490 [Desulfosporosinus sp.]|nr:hypothetical protein [Desulfosporosinus sp.]